MDVLSHIPRAAAQTAFQWDWPKKINRPHIFRLAFIEQNANAVFLGGVGVGKRHLAIALGHTACLNGYSVLFTTAIDIINTLRTSQTTSTLKRELRKYLKPRLLLSDEFPTAVFKPWAL